MVDLKKAPFFLNDGDIGWVKETIEGMTLDEKIGQLFFNLAYDMSEEYIAHVTEDYHIGGARYGGGSAGEVYDQNALYQKYSKIPLFIACNCETGGDGASKTGTFVASHAQCGACATPQAAYDLGYVSGVEAEAVGCNWTFAPIADIYMNWRNTIVNTRSFGSDAELVLERCKAYMDGVHKSNLITCAKHFPGDGVEERDQHLVMGINDLDMDTWRQTFGRVYGGLIEHGLETVMVGHIALPAYERMKQPGIADQDIPPATLSHNVVTGLLREELGFNGLILTDASHMAGMICSRPRREQVPGAIAAGCDMFLFFNDPKEDLAYMKRGYEEGIITEERLQDALMRILGMKAHLGLHRKSRSGTLVPEREGLLKVGCALHHGLILTDASHMAGMICSRPRREQVPGAIAAGCDMFLFFNDPKEDLAYMKRGYEEGIITEERLQDALMRILGMKAHLGLHRKSRSGTLVPEREGLLKVGCALHHELAKKAADASITLLKDTQNLLPVRPEEKPRIRLYYVESAPASRSSGRDSARQLVIEELEAAGFRVDVNESLYDLEDREVSVKNLTRMMERGSVEDFKAKYDAVFLFVNMKGYAQENNVRIRWSASHSNEVPWLVKDVPTLGVSLNYTNHLIDLPMIPTFINAYASTRECIHAVVEKITGKSEFKGRYDESVWCGRWDTRL